MSFFDHHGFGKRSAGAALVGLLLSIGAPAFADSAYGAPWLQAPEGRALALMQKRRSALVQSQDVQGGQNNTVRIVQTGDGNRTLIRQSGSNHTVNLAQHGGNNAQVIVQMGDGATANVTQTGNQSGVLLQFGH